VKATWVQDWQIKYLKIIHSPLSPCRNTDVRGISRFPVQGNDGGEKQE